MPREIEVGGGGAEAGVGGPDAVVIGTGEGDHGSMVLAVGGTDPVVETSGSRSPDALLLVGLPGSS